MREVDPEPLALPVQLGEVDEEELKAYDGSHPKKSLFMAIKGQVYDVTQSRSSLFSSLSSSSLILVDEKGEKGVYGLLEERQEDFSKIAKLLDNGDILIAIHTVNNKENESKNALWSNSGALPEAGGDESIQYGNRHRGSRPARYHFPGSRRDLGVCEQLVEATDILGWKTPSKVQVEAISHALKGRDVIGLANTGSGKTGAFALSIIQALLVNAQSFFACVLSPTRELAIQIYEQFEALGSGIGLKCSVLVGGVDMMQRAISLAKCPHVVELFAKLNRMSIIVADMFVGRERFATLLLMRLIETVILWLSEDQTFWKDIEQGPRPLGPKGLVQFYLDMQFVIVFGQGRYLSRHVHQVIIDIIDKAMNAFSAAGQNPDENLLKNEGACMP